MSLCNRAFHRGLYASCGNPILLRTLDQHRDQAALVSLAGWRAAGSWRAEAKEHKAIAAAVNRGDADRAAQLLHAHISGFITRVLPTITASG